MKARSTTRWWLRACSGGWEPEARASCADRNRKRAHSRVERYVVFNVGGNKYRLIAIVSYPKGKVYIQHVLTHKEYDRGTWKGD